MWGVVPPMQVADWFQGPNAHEIIVLEKEVDRCSNISQINKLILYTQQRHVTESCCMYPRKTLSMSTFPESHLFQ